MTDPNRKSDNLADRANEFAAKAMTAAAPIAAQAAERAKELAAAAAPLAAQAREKAEELLEKAAPTISRGVNAAAESLDHATGGKYSQRISAVTTKIEDRLPKGAPPPV